MLLKNSLAENKEINPTMQRRLLKKNTLNSIIYLAFTVESYSLYWKNLKLCQNILAKNTLTKFVNCVIFAHSYKKT